MACDGVADVMGGIPLGDVACDGAVIVVIGRILLMLE